MKNFLTTLYSLGILSASVACGPAAIDLSLLDQFDDSRPATEPDPAMYSNPVCTDKTPDPTVILADDGYFYVYATSRNVSVHRSRDLVRWENIGTAFTEAGRPSFVADAAVWAPDINKIGNQYVLYYAMSVWGGINSCGIGCAVSDNPAGPFTDKGKMFISSEIGVVNSIDPFYIEENGKKYLFWGSFHGIWWVELSEDGLSVKQGSVPQQVAGSAYEGAYIHKHDGRYYLFASVGSCCNGLESTYRTVVGRSDSLFGPYLDKSGQDMMGNHHELLIQKREGKFVGTGHNSEIVKDNAGNDWILYHAFRVENPDGRVLMLDRIVWNDGWPEVAGNCPSVTAEAPVF
ncbi:MAG: family 43 glycosylhydrolase [Candidatus Cryptobacteroides sp.]